MPHLNRRCRVFRDAFIALIPLDALIGEPNAGSAIAVLI